MPCVCAFRVILPSLSVQLLSNVQIIRGGLGMGLLEHWVASLLCLCACIVILPSLSDQLLLNVEIIRGRLGICLLEQTEPKNCSLVRKSVLHI